jgi:hypothetical protein
MALKPEPLDTAILPGVAGQTVPSAQEALRAFTNVAWQDTAGRQMNPPPSNWGVIPEPVGGRVPESPAGLIGRSIPTDTAIMITITQTSVPK